MGLTSQKLNICTGCTLSAYYTESFKSDILKLSIVAPSDNDERNTALFGLMINLLRGGSEKYPEKSDIIRRLNDLYDSTCSIGGFASGDNKILEISAEMLNDNFTSGENIFEGICDLMYQMLYCPKLDKNGLFPKDKVEREKKVVLDRIKSEKNHSRSYAFKRCREIICENEPYGMSMKREQVIAITPKELTEYYKNFIENQNLRFSYVGRRPANEVAELLKKYYNGTTLGTKTDILPLTAKCERELSSFEEELDIKQSVLVIGMTTDILLDGEDAHIIPVFNTLYGGTYTSRLFRTVREKMSLCYEISSDYVTTKGLMFVSCGIDAGKRDEAQKAILDELYRLQNEKISDEELEITKKLTLKEYYDMLDFPNAIATFYIGREVYGSNMSIGELIKKVEGVTAEEIQAVAKKIKPHTVFFLRGTLADSEEGECDE